MPSSSRGRCWPSGGAGRAARARPPDAVWIRGWFRSPAWSGSRRCLLVLHFLDSDAARTAYLAGIARALRLAAPLVLADLTALEARLAVLPGTVLSRCVGAIEGHLDQAAARLADLEAGGVPDDIGYALETLTADRRRMRFFLGLIIEADQDPALRTMVDGHIAQFDAMVALYYGRARGDADVEAFLSALRGFGMRQLLRDGPPVAIDVPALARRFGLRR